MTARSLLLLAGVLLATPSALLAQDADSTLISAALDRARPIDPQVETFYRSGGFRPRWTGASGLNHAGQEALALLRRSAEHGLDPAHYDVSRLDSAESPWAALAVGAARLADADVALTRGLLAYMHDLRLGRARPSALTRDTLAGDELALMLLRALAADSIAELEREMQPPFAQYRRLQQALRQEQARHVTTNASEASRILKLQLALERLRWLPRDPAQRLVVVNVPSYTLFALERAGVDFHSALESRVIVGDADKTRTPVLMGQITRVEFWPYWNIPRSIATGEILPALRKNSGYLRAHQMEAVNGREEVVGDWGSPELIDAIARGTYSLRQRPSRSNALGRVKFLFPNAASVYLHDTPSPELFARERRDLSHGCIRVEQAGQLAEWVLQDEPDWTPERVREALDGPETIRVQISRPIPVVIVYVTAVARPDGEVEYLGDIYALDPPLAEALH